MHMLQFSPPCHCITKLPSHRKIEKCCVQGSDYPMRLLRGEIPMSMKSEWAQQWRPLDQRWISGCFPRIREQTARSSLIPLGASHKLQILKHKTSNFKTHFGWAKGRDIFLISLTSCLFELLQHWQLMLRYVLGGRTGVKSNAFVLIQANMFEAQLCKQQGCGVGHIHLLSFLWVSLS